MIQKERYIIKGIESDVYVDVTNERWKNVK